MFYGLRCCKVLEEKVVSDEAVLVIHELSRAIGRRNRAIVDSIDMLQVALSALKKGKSAPAVERMEVVIEELLRSLKDDV